MPIRQPMRLTESFDVVSLRDDALGDVPKALMDDYEVTRDLDVLRRPNEDLGWAGLDKLPVQPTICRCRPLRSQFQRLLGIGYDADDQWTIFANHVERISGLQNDDGAEVQTADWFEGKGDSRELRQSVREDNLLPQLFWAEVANVIVQKGTSSKDSPFIPQGTWSASCQMRAHQRRVATIGKLAPSGTSASEKPSASSDETPPSTK